MLTRLDPEAAPSNSLFYEIDEATRAAILADIPVPLGMVDVGQGEHRQTRRLPEGEGIVLDDAPDDIAERSTHLQLAVLAMHGPVGQRVEVYQQKWSLLDVCEVHLGALGHGYYAATRGIHFRDWSDGNVLFRRLPDGKLQGFLVDYGNARHEDTRRERSCNQYPDFVYLCLDDMRSGTDWFRSLADIDTYGSLLCYTAIARKTGKRGLDHADIAERLLEQKARLLRSRHRYIDDLESFMWLLCYQVRPNLRGMRGANVQLTSNTSLVDLFGSTQGKLDKR